MTDYLPRPAAKDFGPLSSELWPYLDSNRWLAWDDIIYQGSRIDAADELEHSAPLLTCDQFIDSMSVRPHSENEEAAPGELFGTWRGDPQMRPVQATLIDGTPITVDRHGIRPGGDKMTGDTTTVTKRPQCDFCTRGATVDGKTRLGPWGYMCDPHWNDFGVGRFGTGYGQRLIVRGTT